MVTGKKIEDHLNALKATRVEQTRLVVSLSKEGFSSCLFDLGSGNCISLMQLPLNEFNSFLDSFNEKGKDLPDVTFFLSHSEVSLVPSSLFQEEDAIYFMRIIHGNDPQRCIAHRMEHLSSHLIFSLKEELKHQISFSFPQAEIHHLAELLLQCEELKLSFKGADHIRAHVEGKVLFLMAYRGKSLELFNTFRTQGPTDTLYYILHSMDSLGMDYKSSELVLTGSGFDLKATEELLQGYCPSMASMESTQEAGITALLSKYQLCVS